MEYGRTKNTHMLLLQLKTLQDSCGLDYISRQEQQEQQERRRTRPWKARLELTGEGAEAKRLRVDGEARIAARRRRSDHGWATV